MPNYKITQYYNRIKNNSNYNLNITLYILTKNLKLLSHNFFKANKKSLFLNLEEKGLLKTHNS